MESNSKLKRQSLNLFSNCLKLWWHGTKGLTTGSQSSSHCSILQRHDQNSYTWQPAHTYDPLQVSAVTWLLLLTFFAGFLQALSFMHIHPPASSFLGSSSTCTNICTHQHLYTWPPCTHTHVYHALFSRLPCISNINPCSPHSFSPVFLNLC